MDVLNAVGGYVCNHPYHVAVSATSLALTPVLGTGWLIALPLKAVGFGTGGVAAGSLAASAQGYFYGAAVPAGGIFAALQHLGAIL